MDCAAECFREFCCRSANFRKTTLNYKRENCELLHGLASEEPQNFKKQLNYDYLVVGQEKPFNCISSPCKNSGRCDGNFKKCSCLPGFKGKRCEIGIPKNCRHIKNDALDHGNGEYIIDPDGGNDDNAFKIYCDMSSFNGGWTMCYTTDNRVDIKREVSSEIAYGIDGYRADCNDIPFTEVMFVDENNKTKAYFTKTGSEITFNDNYNKDASTYGQWNGAGVASGSIKYQLMICDTSFYKGLHVSGHNNLPYKSCNMWYGDSSRSYFRTAAVDNIIYIGVAFNVNGHSPQPKRLVSVGLR